MNSFRGRRRLLAVAVGCAFSATVVPGLRSATAQVKAATVREVGTSFDPPDLRVQVATNADEVDVSWTFVSAGPDGQGHGIKFDDGRDLTRNCPPSPLSVFGGDCQTRPGQTVSRRLSEGTYPYYCKIHGQPGGIGMAGVVVVSVAAESTTTTLARATTTSSTARASTSSTTATTRPLATSSTMATSSTTSTTTDSSSVLLPGDPPAFPGDDTNSSAAGQSGGTEEGSGTGTVALIVALLLAFSAAGGYLLWRLRPGRA